jgi:L-histidine Nalpha-methyltransferase
VNVEAPSRVDPAFREDVLAGFRAARRAIPARWFYDREGSELFERITELPEYYPTRVETALLARHATDVARIVGPGRAVVEFGSGSSTKTPYVLDAVKPAAYVPIDISGDFLRESAAALASDFPKLSILPVEADFTRPIVPPVETLGIGSMLLIGMDRAKDVDTLVRAYDDAEGVTAAFNLNLLHRINRELDADVPVDAFRHRAIWNDGYSRIEMHLEAVRDVAFTIEGERFEMAAGETIHTENSHKYGPRDVRLLLRAGAWTPIAEWTDADDQFALILAEAQPPGTAP